MLALVFLIASVAAPCDDNLPQMDLTECWSKAASASNAALSAEQAKVTAGLRALGVDPAPIAVAQKAWNAAQSTTCDFEEGLYEGGSIAPMIYAMCEDRMARARTARLAALLKVRQNGEMPAEVPASAKASGGLDHFYALLSKQQLTQKSRVALTASQSAWKKYRDAACGFEGGNCLSTLDGERIVELQAGWIGEQFW